MHVLFLNYIYIYEIHIHCIIICGFPLLWNENTDFEGINGVISVKCQIDHLHMVIIINIEIDLYKS